MAKKTKKRFGPDLSRRLAKIFPYTFIELRRKVRVLDGSGIETWEELAEKHPDITEELLAREKLYLAELSEVGSKHENGG